MAAPLVTTTAAGGTASAPSDCVKAMQSYLVKILRPKDATRAIDGIKALLLDRETKTMVSMVYSMHDILSKEGACGWVAGRGHAWVLGALPHSVRRWKSPLS